MVAYILREAGVLRTDHNNHRNPAMRTVKSILPFSIGLVGSALAAAPAAAEDTVLPPIHVHASALGDLDADSTANPYRVSPSSRSSVQVLTAKDIEALNPRDIFDLLSHAEGVFPMYQGRKVPVHLNIRGDTNFAYIVDGAYLEKDTGARILDNLPLSAIEQVEIVRDATALTLGPMVNFTSPSGAPNDGFIVIRTRRPTANGGTVKAAAESYGTASLEAGGDFVDGKGHYVMGMARRYTTDGPSDTYTARDNGTALVKGGFLRDNLSLDLMFYHDRGSFQLQRGDPSFAPAVLSTAKWSFDPIETNLLVANGSMTWNSEQTTLLSLYHNELKATFQQGSFTSSAVTLHDNEDRTTGISLRHSFRRDGTLIQVGGQYTHWETPTGQLFYEYNPRDEEILGGFILGEQKLFNDSLTLDGSYRSDQKKVITGVDSYGHFISYVQSAIHDRTMPAAQFLSLGASWKPVANWLFNARYAYGRQGADLGVVTEPGVTLQPETQQKQELSADYNGLEWMTPRFTVFHTKVENYKSPTRYDPVTQEAVYSQADADRTGIELGAHGHLGESTTWHAAWTRMTGDDMVDDHGRTSPRNLGVVDVTHRFDEWTFNGTVQRVDAFESNFPAGTSFQPIGDYTRVDLNVSRRLRMMAHPVTLMLYGRNVTDEKYQTQYGYPDDGAIWGVSARMDF